MHHILGRHVSLVQDAASWLESLVNNRVDINVFRQRSVLQGYQDGFAGHLNGVWHIARRLLWHKNATVDEGTFGKAVIFCALALGEGAGGDDWHHIVVEELNNDGRGHVVDKVELIGAVGLVWQLNLRALLVHKSREDHIEVEDDIADGGR